MITVFHMNDATWEQSIRYRFGEGKLVAFHNRLETKQGMDKVAEVDTDSLDKAYELTNNINDSWAKNSGVTVFGGKKGYRSTDVGDVMFDGAHAWVVAGCGFINLDTGKEY